MAPPFDLLAAQTQQKLAGEVHIADRIVSLDEPDARPIKKGKSYPKCEFGTTVQMTFNRRGFLITTENFIGYPPDKTVFQHTLNVFRQRLGRSPKRGITDLGYRSAKNRKQTKVKHLFLGRSEDVTEEEQTYCRSARSATEGFIAVAKNLRGFGRSLYRNLPGHRIWTLLCQCAWNLKKFLQLYEAEEISEKSLQKLGLLTR